ncbi:MAG: hypothetical protein ACE5KM_08130 [Planctomycetaceae bacterium]
MTRSLLFVACLLAVSSPVSAESIPTSKRAVDMVALKGGTRLYGAVLSRRKDGMTAIAVQRDWLKKSAKTLYDETIAAEKRRIKSAPQVRRQRIRDWISERAGEKDLLPFLRAELARLEKSGAKPQAGAGPVTAQFIVVTIAGTDVRGGFRQPPQRRRIALLAWKQRLKNVETRSAVSLAKELRGSGKRFGPKSADLSDRLPKSPLETGRQWAARKAIVEFDHLKRVRFQGTDDVLVRAGGDGKPADLSQVFPAMLNAQLNQLVREALGNGVTPRRKKNSALQKAIKTAEQEKVRGFRVTRVKHDLAAKQITVTESFHARMPGGQWAEVWSHRETVDASKKRPDIEKRIKGDERVKGALKLVKGLGLGARQEQIDLAIRFGAAAQIAQDKAAEKFDAFRNAAIQKLDGPAMRW